MQLVVRLYKRLDVVPPSVVVVTLQNWLAKFLCYDVVVLVLFLPGKASWLGDLFDVFLADQFRVLDLGPQLQEDIFHAVSVVADVSHQRVPLSCAAAEVHLQYWFLFEKVGVDHVCFRFGSLTCE